MITSAVALSLNACNIMHPRNASGVKNISSATNTYMNAIRHINTMRSQFRKGLANKV